MKKKLSVGLLTLFTITPLWAEDVDEIVVSATGIPTPISQIGASVDVITAEDLERQQITYLQDALKLKGINVPQNGGPGTSSNVFLRGLPGKYSSLIIDGIDMFDAGFDQVIWNDVITDGVGQIEILRGSQGVLYGSNTITGVISQFTAIGGETENSARIELGEFGTQKFALSSKGRLGASDYGLAIANNSTDGFSAAKRPDGNTNQFDDDAYENTLLNGRIVASLGEGLSIEAAVRAATGEVDIDANSCVDAVGKATEFDRQAFRIALQGDMGIWQHKLGVTSFGNKTDNIDNFVVDNESEAKRQSLDYQGVYNAGEGLTFVFGLDARQTEYEKTGGDYPFQQQEFDTNATYGLVQYSANSKVSATAAIRQDDHDVFGKHETYRATASYYLNDVVRLRVAHGTGYRAPSFTELFGFSGTSIPNPNLKPETSESSEVGADVEISSGFELGLTVFDLTVTDRIAYANGGYTQVSGDSESNGVELNLGGDVSNSISWGFDATYTDSKTPDSVGGEKRQIRVPRSQFALALDYTANNKLKVGASVRHVKGALDTDFSDWPYVDVDLDDYTLLNLNASYQVNDRVKAYGRVENATDEDYETVLGYGTPGRAFYVGVSSSF